MCGNVICSSRHFLSPLHPEHPEDSGFVFFANDGAGSQIPFQFRGFFGFDMRTFCVMTHDLSGAGYFKAFRGRPFGFDLRHFYFSLTYIFICFRPKTDFGRKGQSIILQ